MLPSNILQEFAHIVGREHVLTSPEDLVAYSYDGTSVEHRPDAVVLPINTEQVSRVIQVCYHEGITVVPRARHRLIPPWTGTAAPASPEPIPRGTTVIPSR